MSSGGDLLGAHWYWCTVFCFSETDLSFVVLAVLELHTMLTRLATNSESSSSLSLLSARIKGVHHHPWLDSSIYLHLYTYSISIYVNVCVLMYMWKSENNFWELVLPPEVSRLTH